MLYEHCDDAILFMAQALVGDPGELFENLCGASYREVVQNVKNRLDCRKFHVNNPVTSNAIGHIWVNGY